MPRYNPSLLLYHSPKKKHTARNIFVAVIAVLLLAVVIFFAVNARTILLTFGKGSIEVQDVAAIKTSVAASARYKQVSDYTDGDGKRVLTAMTDNGAAKLTVTETADGKKEAVADIDLANSSFSGIDVSGILKGDLSAVRQAKSEADAYIVPIVGPSEATGLEAYLAKELSAQIKTRPNDLSIDTKIGSTTVRFTGSAAAKKAQLILIQN